MVVEVRDMRAIGFAPAPAKAPAPPPSPPPPPDFDFKVFAAMMKAAEKMTIDFHYEKNAAEKPAKFIDGFGFAN